MQKILVVDDTVMFQRIHAAKLSSEGFRVKTAGDGVEALNHLKNEAVDLIPLDLMMPVMDGFEVLEKPRESSESAKIPVIVFSSRGRAEEIERAVDLRSGISNQCLEPTGGFIRRRERALRRTERGCWRQRGGHCWSHDLRHMVSNTLEQFELVWDLDKVVIGTASESLGLGVGILFRRQDDDRNFLGSWVITVLLDQIEAIRPRHDEVLKDDLGLDFDCQLEGF